MQESLPTPPPEPSEKGTESSTTSPQFIDAEVVVEVQRHVVDEEVTEAQEEKPQVDEEKGLEANEEGQMVTPLVEENEEENPPPYELEEPCHKTNQQEEDNFEAKLDFPAEEHEDKPPPKYSSEDEEKDEKEELQDSLEVVVTDENHNNNIKEDITQNKSFIVLPPLEVFLE